MTQANGDNCSHQASPPPGWQCVPLGKVGEIVSGLTLGRKLGARPTRPVPYLRVANVKDAHLDLSNVYEIQATEEEIVKLRLRAGDLLLTEGGDADKLGRGTLWRGELPLCIHQNHIFRVRFDPERFWPEFIAAEITSSYGKAYFLAHAKQTTGIATINQRVLAGFPLIAPSFSEQQRIAAVLQDHMAAVERARAAAEVRREAATALSAAYVHAALNTAEAARWPMRRLIELCETEGQYGTSVRSNGDGRGVPVLGMFHIHEGRIRWQNVACVKLSEKDQAKYLLRKGDLLFNRTNSAELVGKTAVYDLDRQALFASYLIRFRINRHLADPRFVSFFMNSEQGRRFIERKMARAIGQVNISASTIHQMPMPAPDLAVQQQICEWLGDKMASAATLRSVIRSELEAIRALPSTLLQRAFSGSL